MMFSRWWRKLGRVESKGSRRERRKPPQLRQAGFRPWAEVLEDRTLLSQAIPLAQLFLSDGSSPAGLVAGPDGAAWFTESGADKIGRLTPDGELSEITLAAGAEPVDITVDRQGTDLWFTEPGSNAVARLPLNGTPTSFSISSVLPNYFPWSIAAGSDGALWFTPGTFSDYVGRVTQDGHVSSFDVNGWVDVVAAGPDGTLWLATTDINGTTGYYLGQLSTSGTYSNPVNVDPIRPTCITVGPDGALWFGGIDDNNSDDWIGRLTTGGQLSQYAIGSGGYPATDITTEPNGDVWFTRANHQLGRLTPDGQLTLYPLPSYLAPGSIAVGPDGNIWFTDGNTGVVGKFAVHANPVSTTEGTDFSANLAPFGDTEGFTPSGSNVTIDWGDGIKSNGYLYYDNFGWEISGNHVYTALSGDHTYTVAVTATDDSGNGFTLTGTATAKAAVTVTSLPVTASEGTSFNTVLGTFTDAYPLATANGYSVNVAWGDGNSNSLGDGSGTVTLKDLSLTTDGLHQFQVLGNHTYGEEGTWKGSITVTDNASGGYYATAPLTATVQDASLKASPGNPVSATEAASTGSVVLATFTDHDPNAAAGDYAVTVDWRDGSSNTLGDGSGTVTLNPLGLVNGVPAFQVIGSHTYAEEGNYGIDVTITDTDGGSSVPSIVRSGTAVQVTAKVADAPLRASPGKGIAPVAENSTGQALLATFTDPDPGVNASDYSVNVNWGDLSGDVLAGSFSNRLKLQGQGTVNGLRTFEVFGIHNYSVPGIHSISVSITDIDAGPGRQPAGIARANATTTLQANISQPTRFGLSGQFDTSFGTSGKILAILTDTAYPYAIAQDDEAITSDGGIFAAATPWNPATGNSTIVLSRVAPGGTLTRKAIDLSTTNLLFSGGATFWLPRVWAHQSSIGVQSDGKILVLGEYSPDLQTQGNYFALLRFNADFTLTLARNHGKNLNGLCGM
jgi:virginiamycin B lyase